jgi:tetratricopeptide (TPR) repeat protein
MQQLFFGPALLLAGLALGGAAQDTPPTAIRAREEAQQHERAGEKLLEAHSWAQAAEEFRAAAALDPLLVLAHYNLGQSLVAQKQYAEAVAAYEACRDAFERRNSLSERERAEREHATEDEIRELRESIRRLTNGNMLEQRLRLLEQTKLSGHSTLHVPAELHLALGSAYFHQNKLAEAEQAYVAAVDENKKLGAAHNNLAVIYMLTGRFAEARQAVKRAEKAGFPVNPALKADIDKREAAATQSH